MIIPRTVVRFGVRRVRTKGRVGIGKSDETGLSNLQAKTERYMGIPSFALTKLNNLLYIVMKRDIMPLEKKLNYKVIEQTNTMNNGYTILEFYQRMNAYLYLFLIMGKMTMVHRRKKINIH